MTIFLVINGIRLCAEGFFAEFQHVVDEVPAGLVGLIQDLGGSLTLQDRTCTKKRAVCEGDGGVIVESKRADGGLCLLGKREHDSTDAASEILYPACVGFTVISQSLRKHLAFVAVDVFQ